MKTQTALVAVAVLFLAGVAFNGLGQPPPPSSVPHVVAWEFKVIPVEERELNRLGAEGWELAGVTTEITSGRSGTTTGGISSVTSRASAIMKRPKR